MKNVKFLSLFFLFCSLLNVVSAQKLKKSVTPDELKYIEQVFEFISESDQRYRSYLQYETLDDQVIAKIDSVLNNVGVKEGLSYQQSLNLSLPENIKDSLWAIQSQLDFRNHVTIRGIWETYGYVPKKLVEGYNYVQVLLLMHPPKDWDIPTFHNEYAGFLVDEVHAGRMPPKTYATFYDNILCKILRKPQLYGTNEQFDPKLGKILPPIIEDLAEANKAREAIGLPLLKDGEYRLGE